MRPGANIADRFSSHLHVGCLVGGVCRATGAGFHRVSQFMLGASLLHGLGQGLTRPVRATCRWSEEWVWSVVVTLALESGRLIMTIWNYYQIDSKQFCQIYGFLRLRTTCTCILYIVYCICKLYIVCILYICIVYLPPIHVYLPRCDKSASRLFPIT